MQKLRIAIDNGHGYNTAGKRTPIMLDGRVIREWEFNHPTAKRLQKILLDRGHEVLMVSDTREDTGRAIRVRQANQWNADVFVSIHYNAHMSIWGTHGGIETLYYHTSNEGKKLAEDVQNKLIEATGLRNRGAKPRSNLQVLNDTKMLAILTECGFMDNIKEAGLMLDPAHQENCAKAIADGLEKYFKAKAPDVPPKEEEKEPVMEDDSKPVTLKISCQGNPLTIEGTKRHNVNYVPIRELESMGYVVNWNEDTGTVEIRDADFIQSIKDVVIEEYLLYGILPSLTIAQAVLESNWGKTDNGNNIFGIKADSRWTGKTNAKETKEYINGEWVTVIAKFRAYGNFTESIRDRSEFLMAPRYAKVLQTKNYKTACTEIYKAGYATDPQYPSKLINIIEQNKLHEIDNLAFSLEGLVDIKINYNGVPVNTKGWKKDGVNHVPIRLLESLNKRVDWDGQTNTIKVE